MPDSEARVSHAESEYSASYREVDRILVSVASGVIAVSVAFLGNLEDPIQTCAIKGSWLFLLATVVLVLASLLFEQSAWKAHLDAFYKQTKLSKRVSTTVVQWLNYVGVTSFLLGLGFMIYFLWANTKD